MTGCIFHDDNGVQCERDPGHKGKHAYDLAMGGQHEWTRGLVPATRIAELERAAGTTRAEHAAALGLATARIRELEGERDELMVLLQDRQRSWCPVVEYPHGLKVDECSWEPPCWEHRRRAIVARIEKATKGTERD